MKPRALRASGGEKLVLPGYSAEIAFSTTA